MLVCLYKTDLVDSFGRTRLGWAFIRLGSHRWMPRAHMLDEESQNLNSLKMNWMIYPIPHMKNIILRRGNMSLFLA
jgi:hypothetical protein